MSETKPTPESLEAAESCVYRWYGKHPTLVLHSSIREDLQARVAHEIDSRVSQAVREERERGRCCEGCGRKLSEVCFDCPGLEAPHVPVPRVARLNRAHPTSEPSSGEPAFDNGCECDGCCRLEELRVKCGIVEGTADEVAATLTHILDAEPAHPTSGPEPTEPEKG